METRSPVASQSSAKRKEDTTAAYRRSPICGTRSTCVPRVGIQREQKKQHAQNVLSLGRPCNRLDIDRMQRKQCGNHQAAPAESRGALQQQKEKHGVGRVSKTFT